MRKRTVVAAIVVLCSTLSAEATEVFPGPGALQAAIDAADEGDTLKVHAGTYAEAITVNKRLRIVGIDATPPSIDPGCSASAGVVVAADRVYLRNLIVFGGTFFGVDIEFRDRVTVRRVQTFDNCNSAEYGINVFDSNHVTVHEVQTFGFGDAGIYVGGIPAGNKVRVLENSSGNDVRGIIVEDSVGSVKLTHNEVSDSTTAGIFLHNSDGILLVRNGVRESTGSGIELDSTSDENRLVGNAALDNAIDVVDNGSSNCWKGTIFGTGTLPAGGCP